MHRTSFNDGWSFRPKVNPFAEPAGVSVPFAPVKLPHDAMLAQRRQADASPAAAYFPGGTYGYRKTFPVPAEELGNRILIALSMTDPTGVVHTAADRPITIEISGDGELIGFGSADPSTAERFDAITRTSYQGRAPAILRPTGPGKIRLLATAEGCEPAEVTVTVENESAA